MVLFLLFFPESAVVISRTIVAKRWTDHLRLKSPPNCMIWLPTFVDSEWHRLLCEISGNRCQVLPLADGAEEGEDVSLFPEGSQEVRLRMLELCRQDGTCLGFRRNDAFEKDFILFIHQH